MDSDSDKERKRYLTMKWIHLGIKIAVEIAAFVFIISCIPLLSDMSQYVSGEKVFENALTTSQITGIFLMGLICYAIYIVGKMMRKL